VDKTVRKALTARTTRRAARAPAGPKPFSREWLNAPPAERNAPPRPPIVGAPPSWVPAERTIAIVLVALLVLLATIFQTRLAPGLRADTEGGVVAPLETPESADPTPVPTAAGMITSPETDSTPIGGDTELLLMDPILPDSRIVAYYGHPNAESMGILGLYDMDELLEQLRDQARAYEVADPDRPVVMAFELIGSVAQPEPGPDGSYLLWTDPETIRQFVDFTQANDLLLIIDIQIGRTSVEEEMAIIEEFLIEPNGHLAIDPEFAVDEDQVPSVDIGGVDADDINYAQEELARIVEEHNLPPKLLIVHRFTDGMIRDADDIDEVENVQFILDFDGFGDPVSKQEGYHLYANEDSVEHTGIKLFYDQDQPLMQPADVLELDPSPDFVMYQ
jgi:hypothetical protein